MHWRRTEVSGHIWTERCGRSRGGWHWFSLDERRGIHESRTGELVVGHRLPLLLFTLPVLFRFLFSRFRLLDDLLSRCKGFFFLGGRQSVLRSSPPSSALF